MKQLINRLLGRPTIKTVNPGPQKEIRLFFRGVTTMNPTESLQKLNDLALNYDVKSVNVIWNPAQNTYYVYWAVEMPISDAVALGYAPNK